MFNFGTISSIHSLVLKSSSSVPYINARTILT